MELKNEIQILNSCFACLRHSEDSLQILRESTPVDQQDPVAIVALLTKYFWFQQDDFNPDHVLCRKCWTRLSEFHQFYLEVERNHCSLNLAPEPEVCSIEIKEEEVAKEESADPVAVEVVDSKLEKKPTDPVKEAASEEVKDEDSAESGPEEDVVSEEEYKPDDVESPSEAESEPEPVKKVVKPKRKYTKRKKAGEPPAEVKKKATYEIKSAKQLAEEDEIIKTHVQYICEVCGNQSPTFTHLQRHMTTEHGLKGCITCCGTRYHRKVRLLEHVQKLKDADCFKCDLCNKSFVNKRGIKRHKENMHVPDELKVFRCERCPKRFTSKSQLAYHLKGHDTLDNERAKCTQCERIFESESQLKVHIKIRHTRPTDYICDVCAKGFYSKTDFLRHKKLHDLRPEELRVQCDICQMWLKNKHGWKKHYRRHTQGPATCDICGHVSPNNLALGRHKRYLHHTERSFTCQECGKQFKRALVLREHMASHTGEALYSCSFCDKTFNSNANMFSHRKKMHPKEWLAQKLAAQQGVSVARNA